jgi:GNAT superfamily N-acetyltransferase
LSKIRTGIADFTIRRAESTDCQLIHSFICELAVYEKLRHEVKATPDTLRDALFGERAFAKVYIGEFQQKPVGYALFFHNYSTFTGRPGIYLEDIYIKPEMRGQGFGKMFMCYVAKLAVLRNCTRFEWSVLNWNKPSIDFYRSIGARSMDEWTVQRLDGDALASLARAFDNDTSNSG